MLSPHERTPRPPLRPCIIGELLIAPEFPLELAIEGLGRVCYAWELDDFV